MLTFLLGNVRPNKSKLNFDLVDADEVGVKLLDFERRQISGLEPRVWKGRGVDSRFVEILLVLRFEEPKG